MDELDEAIALLRRIKREAELTRRFSAENPPFRASVDRLTQIEGDVEEWLIDHGYSVAEPANPRPDTASGKVR